MSHEVLQRVVVRMHYDPGFRGRVFTTPDVALAGLSLSAVERRWLLASDPRAYATDPLRASRTLQALIEEYPASTLMLGVEPLGSFFQSPVFHRAVTQRGRLVLAFAGWLAERAQKTAQAAAIANIAQVELAIAQARRRGVGLAQVGDQTLAHYTRVRAILATSQMPIHDLIQGALTAPRLAVDGSEVSYVLAQRDEESREVSLSEIDAPLFAVLDAAWRGLDPRDAAIEQGADALEAAALLTELAQEGLLP